MAHWQDRFLGIGELPPELSIFEIEFFQFSAVDIAAIRKEFRPKYRIAVITIPENAEKRSRLRWNRCSRSSGLRVHDALETAFTLGRNTQYARERRDYRL